MDRLKQDVKVLDKNIVEKGVISLKDSITKNSLNVEDIDYFLPHLSSMYFQESLFNELLKQEIGIPKEKWFTNLKIVGNVGSASIYLIIDELKNSGKLKKGDKILVIVPESGRFMYYNMLLTVC